MKILIADDDATTRRMMESALIKSGYQVQTAEDGISAAEALCAPEGPRLALLDWMMPGMDGPSICNQVRRTREQPYVYMVLLTSKDGKSDVIAGLEAGADDYLTKPFHPDEVRARLRSGERILKLEDKLVEAREDMRYRATRDALTSLWNRGVIMELFDREIRRARREHASLGVLICDVDHFKRINDTYGHPVGDEILQELSRRMLQIVRSYDAVGRIGGEEFLILLFSCELQGATARAEEIRAVMARHPVHTASGPIPVTISVGALASQEWGNGDADLILKEADAALYRAKAAGRNRVMVARPESVERFLEPAAAEEPQPRR